MALTATVRAEITASQTNPLDLGTGTMPIAAALTLSFTDGAAANQVNQAFSDTRTLTASANEDLDLAGVLTNAFGATITFARVKAILVKAASGNTNDVIVGGAAATQFVGFFGAATHTVAVKPGGAFLIVTPSAAGWPVTAGSTDFLRIANSAGTTSVTYDIVILGSTT